MALRRRDQIPPYEIMRSRTNTGAPGVGAGEPVESESPNEVPWPEPTAASGNPAPASAAGRAGGGAPWWVGSSAPIVLRVPRGLAGVIVIGVLGLFVLSYWVGTVRGKSASQSQQEQRSAVAGEPVARRTPPIAVSNEGRAQNTGQGETDGPIVQVTQERREPGLNYLCLLTSSEEECTRLAEFLAGKQVAIQLVKRDNTTFVVYAVDYGFRGSELSSDECLAYKRKLQDLGRAWKRSNNNRGTDLGTMYFVLYKGPSD